jgi:hypothetical protein
VSFIRLRGSKEFCHKSTQSKWNPHCSIKPRATGNARADRSTLPKTLSAARAINRTLACADDSENILGDGRGRERLVSVIGERRRMLHSLGYGMSYAYQFRSCVVLNVKMATILPSLFKICHAQAVMLTSSSRQHHSTASSAC